MTTNIMTVINDIAGDMTDTHIHAMESENCRASGSDADDWCAGNLRDELMAHEIPGVDEAMVDDLRAALRDRIASEMEKQDEYDLEEGAEYVDAVKNEGTGKWVFFNAASGEWFAARTSDMRRLGTMLRRRTSLRADAYRLWAVDTDLDTVTNPDAE
jgi:hypothetical protein